MPCLRDPDEWPNCHTTQYPASFHAVTVEKKTEQIRKQYGCQAVEFSVDVTDGDVKLKAKAKS